MKALRYTGKQSVLDASLGDFGLIGFALVENDDHILELKFKEVTIEYYNQLKVTVAQIRARCHEYLAMLEGLADF